MSSTLHRPPSQLAHATALRLSQQAPNILANSPGAGTTSAIQALFAASETPELWTVYENLLLSCLRTEDGESAHRCLGRLVERFGDDNERIMALIGLLKEADAEDDATLEIVLAEYDQILASNPTNTPVTKRRIALLRSLGRVPDAVAALIAHVDFNPLDAEAWSELSDLYFSQGLYSQAIFSLEEVLILQPNAWNVHARLGELLLMAVQTASSQSDSVRQLSEALKRFCRSIELCDDYLRGYYGLKLTTKRLFDQPPKSSKQTESDGLTLPDSNTVKKLDELATTKLAEITRRFAAGERGWQGYDAAEISAARDLLERDSQETVR